MKNFMRALAAGIAAAVVFLLGAAAAGVPDTLYALPDDTVTLCAREYIKIKPQTRAVTASAPSSGCRASAALLGIIPIKQVEIKYVQERTVALMGTPIGVTLHTDGVVVSDTADVITAAGAENPCERAGISRGDTIISVNGAPIDSASELMERIMSSGGSEVTLDIRSPEGDVRTVRLSPALSAADGCWRAGIWARDCSAGIGILTYVEPDSMTFGGLGHAICDTQDESALPADSGEVTDVVLTGLVPGASGKPGELVGYLGSNTLGILSENTDYGIFGSYCGPTEGALTCPAALKQQTLEGSAQILTTLPNEKEPRFFDAVIERISYDSDQPTRNMVIRVTDSELLDIAGGIVQGMSGSPIVQNGRFIGAVTHVFVNDPTRGYAIFAENMLYHPANSEKNSSIAA